MRIINKTEKINYENTKKFFDNRVNKYSEGNPYSVTMYQDNNPELVIQRNRKEMDILLPQLMLDNDSSILDIACGIGRWSDAIPVEIKEYCGIDFCEGLIELAKKRNVLSNRRFIVGKSSELLKILADGDRKKYNRFLLVGSLMYLNDEDVLETLKQVEIVADENAIICIREPIGINDRLTLKEQFSEELNDSYNAIYRTRDELFDLINRSLISKGFVVTKEEYLFKDSNLNNRKETAQYYFIIERKSL